MPPSLSELKVKHSFCFAFKISDNPTATNQYPWILWISIPNQFQKGLGLIWDTDTQDPGILVTDPPRSRDTDPPY